MSTDTQVAEVRTFGKRGVRQAPVQARAPARLAVDKVSQLEDEIPSDVQRLFGAIPLLTFGLIVGLALIFGLEQRLAFDVGPGASLSQESLVALGAASREHAIGAGQVWRLFLAPLLHASSAHLIGNCVAMALVGFLLEPIIGRGWFGLIFAASAVGGITGSMIGNPSYLTTVGASGAITGLIAAAFVMSFHGRADPEDAAKMRRRALFFGVPALLPLFLGAQGHTDYHAHLGGALVGAAIALALAFSWDGTSFRPRWAGQAAMLALATLAVSALSCVFIPGHFAEQAAIAQTLMPDATAALPADALKKQSSDLASRYPDDPRAQLIRATTLAQENRLGEAEVILRRTMTMLWPARRFAETAVHKRAQAFLAAVLAYDHDRVEARDLARDLCHDASQSESWPMLTKAELCPQ
jgi:rhomboid protease GluP